MSVTEFFIGLPRNHGWLVYVNPEEKTRIVVTVRVPQPIGTVVEVRVAVVEPSRPITVEPKAAVEELSAAIEKPAVVDSKAGKVLAPEVLAMKVMAETVMLRTANLTSAVLFTTAAYRTAVLFSPTAAYRAAVGLTAAVLPAVAVTAASAVVLGECRDSEKEKAENQCKQDFSHCKGTSLL
jgi:hypothetical protein